MKLATLFMLSILFPFTALSQISFDRADVETEMSTAQVTSYEAGDAAGKTFDLSGPVYDFTGFQTQSSMFQRQYLDPATTTFPHEFPTATHAQAVTSAEGTGFMYLRLDDTGLYFQGFGTIVQGADYLLKYSPERPSMKFPFKKGTSWNYTSGTMVPFEGMSQVEESRIEVIADGTIKTPQGEAQCIVVKDWERSTTKLEFNGQIISESYTTIVSYNFMTKAGISATIVVDSIDENSSTPMLESVTWAVVDGQTAVDPVPVAGGLRIDAAYPNPARAGDVTVRWNTRDAGDVQLALTDLYGRVLREVHVGHAGSGTHAERMALQNLPAGQYFLRLSQGGNVAIRPLTVVH